MAEKNPLIEALPPATDYLSYLTIIEYNLNPESLPTLHQVLQDTKLTTNIGWDLVHLLVPMLPNSNECLQDIARLGNPREVILKVTESLRLIDFQGLEPDTEDDEPIAGQETTPAYHPAKTEPVEGNAGKTTQAVETPAPLPLPVLQFTSLLSMLSILHARIKTKYPSRFLATTLQSVLASFSNAEKHKEEMIASIIQFVKSVSGTKRPNLPPRKSSTQILTATPQASAPDPESDTAAESPSASETAIQKRLFQSFITHVFEDYVLSLTSDRDAPGLAWCSRLQEKLHPERTVPGKPSMTDSFILDEELASRLTAVGGLVALARDLGLERQDLLPAMENADPGHSIVPENEDEFPKTATDIPLSKVGSLFMFAAAHVATVLYSTPKPKDAFSIFPEHQKLLKNYIASSSDMGSTIGTEPEAMLDAVLALAVLAVEEDNVGQPADSEEFSQYLQYLSLISSNSPSPSIRYHAFYLASTILRSNPSDVERLAFIKDTLEHCPFDNLKVAAISWVKGETIEANPPTPIPTQVSGQENSAQDGKGDASVFATPVALDSLAPYLFPDLTHDLTANSITESWFTFQQSLHFYLASLNFYYLLLSAQHLHNPLSIGDLHSNNDVAGSFLQPLRAASARFKEGKANGELADVWEETGGDDTHMAELGLLDVTLEKVTAGVARLNQAHV
ncbi:hypothetical protein AUEXF2481DRAFT_39157 [Aureobasidium subglaciale EXF-2481]|uniref:DUF1760-domain-containing protein n=1 Tax=Aureobasidium subglaciale (strain EXF-2481) TaxID=1043005 RepID=A0A074ZBG7_AURSE|nr:uncharacterized protein AUEXF2481DRAFT_39157 [Aureobasidium subglaciale EXF-2481]KAI5211001.1 DUF1760-domain-containing protein [Aureobasidium subglaciale]KAI5222592.1 DUF1760-domain-containing protein [Aureobasidium subglaciale]KAI5233237.1 DUF1760-domain-containing protein [Aureobasidium subglaciale]KAI5262263.1 DUF1760-domain-containing protein [Aureobasidium subglaciale]KEQ96071.1 hypothetical protein AUEXF2481DRAFT_39157 [Aureobasidium subglaciale EXF-2481]